MIELKNVCAIVLAAGKGKRINAKGRNKVTYEIHGKPMIVRIVENVKKAGIKNIVLVVGYARISVEKLFPTGVVFAVQRKRLGTGHALLVGFKKIPQSCKNIFAFYGDDTSYSPEILLNLLETHTKHNADLSFLTLEVDDPTGLGRIIRDNGGKAVAIIEEKDATDAQKEIKEINPGCFIFTESFLKKYISKIPKSHVTREYYLTSLIEIGFKNKAKVETHKVRGFLWRGVNTTDELHSAAEILKKK